METQLRIAHVIIAAGNEIGANRDDMQGLGRHVLNLAVAQKVRGLNPVLISNASAERPLVEALQGEGIPVVIMPSAHLQPNQTAKDQTAKDLAAQIEKFNVQLIHCHNLNGVRVAVPMANQIGIPCVLTVHRNSRSISILYEAAKRQGLKFSMICVSRRERDSLRESGISEADLYYVPNGTRSLPVHQLPEPHYPDLTLVGRIILIKGVDVAILAMAELRRRLGPDVPVLNVYGVDPSGNYFREMVHAVGLDDIVRFHGFKLDVLEHCDSRDILVMPSRSETGPLVVLEAMSRGMPIVATEVGEVTEMLPDPRYGRVVRPDSVVALADGIESLLKDISDGHFDPSLVIERHRSRYTVEKMAEDVETVYKQVLVNNNPY